MIINLFDRMKLPFRKNKEFLSALYDILGFYPHNIEIYRIAFSHKSLSYRRDTDGKKGGKDRKFNNRDRKPRSENTSKPLNNERLEYLGDAVLETIVSDILFRHFPHKREGFLTSTRSKIVQREALNRLAADMGLEKLILAAQGTRMSHTNIGGNAFEALMGAIYLDRGFKTCQWFINNRVIGQYVDLDNVAQKEVNFKSKLLEWSQKNRININFKDTASDGEKGFRTVISIEGITIARGSGRSKKESQQEASKEALTRMRREPATYDSIFHAKEQRTAMEAEESFALPKIDAIEDGLNKGKAPKCKGRNRADAPVLEEESNKTPKSAQELSDEAYDTAYDEAATYEVIDTPPAEPVLTAEDYEAKGLPAPPEEDELKAADESLRKKRTRNRGPKTMGDAVKGQTKGATTTEERAAKRDAERQAEVERQRAKAERKRQMAEKAKAKAEAEAAKAEAAKAEAAKAETENDATEVKTEVKTDIIEAKTEVAQAKAETTEAAVEVAEVKTETNEPKADTNGVKAEAKVEAVTETLANAAQAEISGLLTALRTHADHEAEAITEDVHAEAEQPIVQSAEIANEVDTTSATEDVQIQAEEEETFIIKEDLKPAPQAEDKGQKTSSESESHEAADETPAEMEAEVETEAKPQAETAVDSVAEKAESPTEEARESGHTANTAETVENGDKEPEDDSEADTITSIMPSLTLDDIVFGTENDEHFAALRDNDIDNSSNVNEVVAPKDEVGTSQDKPQRNKKRNNNRRRRRPQNANKQAAESSAKEKTETATSANAPATNADKPKPHKHRGRRRPNKGNKEGEA